MSTDKVNSNNTSAAASSSLALPFSLIVTLKFKSKQHKDQFLIDVTPLASYIQKHEPTTLAYNVLLSDKDPLQVLLIERYEDKENAFLNIHRSSEEFQEFRSKLKAMEENEFVEIDGHSYLDSSVGFGDRAASSV
eukprot:CAMPEP_0185732040 /NCGR_PEP_ID=MMETSP1171-20130828/14758_1 /TAXON_ID=374046 /ORGANISM="Helicotheca tamensis, Strain CCMP826" /LENGTH=134 /DNA_ID=CAMNT_0028401425 /DNA_START=146 /DNA_END=550 /DNA_ORIENTATION=-